MKGEPVKYNYNTRLEWTSEKKGVLRCEDKLDIIVATPPEFNDHPGIWLPEDLFLASVEVCTLTTFLWYVNKEHVKLKSYNSKAVGTVEMVGDMFKFSSITVKLRIGVSSEDDRTVVEKIVKKVSHACLISIF